MGVVGHSCEASVTIPPHEYASYCENGLRIERNVAVPLRDGVRLLIDIYRPEKSAGELPILLGWSPYGKHNTPDKLTWAAAEVAASWISRYTVFEAPDPVYWCAHGYAVVYPDPRGSGYSEGELRDGASGEAQDCCDLIEWLGKRSWSNGKVGMSGVSYLGAIQWQVAALRPAHLAALNPWEGLYEDYWAREACALEAIDLPAYIVASWSDQGPHTRGALEAYKRIASRAKWLEVHGGKKWHEYYEPSRVEKQRQFFDHFLKTRGSAVPAWARVLIEVRERAHKSEVRAESAWPLARTEFRKLYLDAARHKLRDQPGPIAVETHYDPRTECATFDYRFEKSTELTGHMKLRLWVEAVGSDDMDVFVAIQKLDRDGAPVPFVVTATHEGTPVALGWLRASHRELDVTRSRPEQPFHPHTREQRLSPGERVALEIEIRPASTRFLHRETLRLRIQGRNVPEGGLPDAPFARHQPTRNAGLHVIHAGGMYDSHLLIPVIPSNNAT